MNPIIINSNVTDTITGALVRHGFRNGTLEDAVSEVRVRALEAVDDGASPSTVPQWQALCAKIAVEYAIDEHRRTVVRDKYDEGPCDTPDAYVPPAPSGEVRDPVDARWQLEVLLDMFHRGEMPEKGEEILEAVADRVKIPQIGREVGLTPQEVRNRLRQMRRLYFKRLAALGMLVLMMVMFSVFAGPAGVAVRDEAPPGGASATAKEVTPSPEEMAAVMRKEAFAACQAWRWDECEAKLDAAQDLDPAGDHAPEVQEARGRVNRGMEEPLREFEAKTR